MKIKVDFHPGAVSGFLLLGGKGHNREDAKTPVLIIGSNMNKDLRQRKYFVRKIKSMVNGDVELGPVISAPMDKLLFFNGLHHTLHIDY